MAMSGSDFVQGSVMVNRCAVFLSFKGDKRLAHHQILSFYDRHIGRPQGLTAPLVPQPHQCKRSTKLNQSHVIHRASDPCQEPFLQSGACSPSTVFVLSRKVDLI
ncbi:hypothetical protein E1B28_010700 [Marasmius oreades]|uniref:Uncharacterized protein n=1 Tax=Marasmius oreades TaxID=181124 RepID=A0A9P7RXT2_9AGAR|nr:uncharacterized protein E1B28_010700 [Marasmius oreades]KAG7091680.1 hypothetical protein E1B28_010700 [Marasmius oreades]